MKRFIRTAVMAACFAVAVVAPAWAEIGTDDPDLRCVAAGLIVAASDDVTQQNAGTMIAVHYIGKLQGREPNLDLEEELFQYSLVASELEMAADNMRCGTEFQALGYQMIEMGENLQRRARELESQN